MAHEELKKLYEIDEQHSDTPWEWWEFLDGGSWSSLGCAPGWFEADDYRRKPDAPVWPDDKEDARKWRELDKHFEDAEKEDHRAFHWKFLDIKYGKAEPQLIQGYTAEQWQVIIDGKFLCEFSDIEGFGDNPLIQTLKEIDPFRSRSCLTWNFCRPLRIKGVRQPWFGGERPVALGAKVVVTSRAGVVECCQADDVGWQHKPDHQLDIVEFIEL